MKVGLFVIKFIVIGSLFIIANHQLHIANLSERETFYDLFYNWLDKLFDQSKNILGYVTKSEWLPHEENIFFSTK